MGKILIYTNLTGSTNVVDVESYMKYCPHEYTFDTVYYNHCRHDHSQYDRVFALVDTSCDIVSEEFKQDLLAKVKTLHNKKATIVLCNFWESRSQILKTGYTDLLKDYDYTVWDGANTYFWFKMYERYHNSTFKFNHTLKPYDFLYLNKTQRKHRDLLFDELINKNLLSNSLYSYHHRGITLNPEYESQPHRKGYPKYGADRDIFEKPYNETVFNIVSETSVDESFITEKLWKPIIAKQIFIVHGKAHYLNAIKQLGFQTYHDFIDEGYDSMGNFDQRTSAIVSLCKNIKGINHLELYYNSESVRNHNFKTFFSKEMLERAIVKDINSLFELVDSSKVSS